MAFSPDGTRMASAGNGLWGGEVYDLHVRTTKTWKEVDLLRLPRERSTCLAFTPDGAAEDRDGSRPVAGLGDDDAVGRCSSGHLPAGCWVGRGGGSPAGNVPSATPAFDLFPGRLRPYSTDSCPNPLARQRPGPLLIPSSRAPAQHGRSGGRRTDAHTGGHAPAWGKERVELSSDAGLNTKTSGWRSRHRIVVPIPSRPTPAPLTQTLSSGDHR
jgi:hypothetical protein